MGSCYDSMDEVIFINLFAEEDNAFIEHVINSHGFVEAGKYSNTFWTILHEVGHYFTENMFEEDTEIVYETDDLTAYFNLENEWLATEWAIDFILAHPIISKIFSKAFDI